jgi:hypothetical protein
VGRAWPKLRARSVPRETDPALYTPQFYDPAKPFGGNVRLNDLWAQSKRPAYRRI